MKNNAKARFALADIFAAQDMCLENASQLLDEAIELCHRESFARSIALAVLCGEELGKILILATAARLRKSDASGYKEFKRRFRDHRSKQLHFFSHWVQADLAITTDPSSEKRKTISEYKKQNYSTAMKSWRALESKLKDIGCTVDQLKQRAIYVGLENDSFISPSSLGPEIAEPLLDYERRSLELWRELLKRT